MSRLLILPAISALAAVWSLGNGGQPANLPRGGRRLTGALYAVGWPLLIPVTLWIGFAVRVREMLADSHRRASACSVVAMVLGAVVVTYGVLPWLIAHQMAAAFPVVLGCYALGALLLSRFLDEGGYR